MAFDGSLAAVPSAVSRLDVTESGSNHLVVEWSSPLEENGIISNYILTYAIGKFIISTTVFLFVIFIMQYLY